MIVAEVENEERGDKDEEQEEVQKLDKSSNIRNCYYDGIRYAMIKWH